MSMHYIASQLEGLVKLEEHESIEFASFIENEDTLYLEVHKIKKLTNPKNDFSIGFENIYRPERITKIVLIDGDSYVGLGKSRGIAVNDLKKGLNQKVLWEKKE